MRYIVRNNNYTLIECNRKFENLKNKNNWYYVAIITQIFLSSNYYIFNVLCLYNNTITIILLKTN